MEKPVVPLANVADLLLDAICVVDTEGRYLYVSAAYERIFGYPPEEVLGRRMIDLVHPDDRERTLRAAEEIMHGQPKLHFQNRYLRKDGQVVHVMWSARWSEADQARIAVARDITELKRAETIQAALYAISEAAFATKDLLALFQRIHRIIASCCRRAISSWHCATTAAGRSTIPTSWTSTTRGRIRSRWIPARSAPRWCAAARRCCSPRTTARRCCRRSAG